MNKSNLLQNLAVLFLLFLIQGCGKTTNIPTPTSILSNPTLNSVITQIVGTPTIQAPLITLTPPTTDQNSIVVQLSVNNEPPNTISLTPTQKLFVIPPPGWGYYGWILTYDTSFFRLDLTNEPKWPVQGWWIWIPLKTGQSSLVIRAVPPPCMNTNPPCAFPEYAVRLNIEVAQK